MPSKLTVRRVLYRKFKHNITKKEIDDEYDKKRVSKGFRRDGHGRACDWLRFARRLVR